MNSRNVVTSMAESSCFSTPFGSHRVHRSETVSHIPKTFSEIFIVLLEYRENLGHFEGKDQLHILNISEVDDPEEWGYFKA